MQHRNNDIDHYPYESEKAKNEAWLGELGKLDDDAVDEKLRTTIGREKDWILIGGPPCQAYSVAGRARNKAKKGYIPEKDQRHFLYKQYLRIIANHWPSVFIMENVRGILSSKINGKKIFPKILKDLTNPAAVFNGNYNDLKFKYKIFSLSNPPENQLFKNNPEYRNFQDFTIQCEKYGVPQARHRVILLGIREDRCKINPEILTERAQISVMKTIGKLPRLRSGFSRGEDSKEKWKGWLNKIRDQKWFEALANREETIDLYHLISKELNKLTAPNKNRGNEFISYNVKSDYLPDWFVDNRIGGICNYTTRGHMDSDLYRYFYAACFSKLNKRSPLLSEFPDELLPNHKNARKTNGHGNFADRFRVQLSSKFATTIMSHISKDGHYYIHYDPTQCRSLTVREAARLQTFPDNYFFCGPRTEQYVQVGNAVPPYLAYQIAKIVLNVLSTTTVKKQNGQPDKGKTKLEYVPN